MRPVVPLTENGVVLMVAFVVTVPALFVSSAPLVTLLPLETKTPPWAYAPLVPVADVPPAVKT